MLLFKVYIKMYYTVNYRVEQNRPLQGLKNVSSNVD